MTDDTAGTAGVVSLDTRDGGAFADDLAPLALNTGYDIRLEIDTAGGDSGNGGFDIYVNDALVYTNADFRRGYGVPLENVLLMAGNNAVPNVRIDDISIVPEPALLGLLSLGMLFLRRRGACVRTIDRRNYPEDEI